ncbi:hypothetical protein SAMN05216262_1287 [Colwellia chukchiensis]|uniref:Uncharacterized protein n=1 Tax=Colwellia chukchiensis TaxID=641665 RepID=A0A1H7TTE8_9GAMM|nr:hypothetical protein SAMN05216262_1287 [Colwellia chukchiensis]
MLKSHGQQLCFNFHKSTHELIPEDITLDELLNVLNNHSDSDLARRYYFEQISMKRKKR